ncbi:hypothetical protein TNCV_1235511 [Trichonephila clavipes]|nr:hypothetical protein TNCV_1235511 [Trichonephila clavipes]
MRAYPLRTCWPGEALLCPSVGPEGVKVLKMSPKKVFKTAEEAVEYLFLEELESKMIALPPEVDELTDEEGFNDTNS